MYCVNCGSELPAGSIQCLKCIAIHEDSEWGCDDSQLSTSNTAVNLTDSTETSIAPQASLSPIKFSLIYLAIAFGVILAFFILGLLSTIIVGDGVLTRFFLGAVTVCTMLLPIAIIILIILVIRMRLNLHPKTNKPHTARAYTRNEEEKAFLKQQRKAARQELKAAEVKVKNAAKAYKDKIASLQKESARCEKDHFSNINAKEAEYNKVKKYYQEPIARYCGATLSRQRFTYQGSFLSLDSNVHARVETEGQIDTTTNYQFKKRPTLTRVVAGGLIAGPIGAVVGGAAQKQTVNSTKETLDTRKVYLYVENAERSIMVSQPQADSGEARQFAIAVNNAARNAEAIEKEKSVRLANAKDAISEAKSSTSALDEIKKQISLAEADNGSLLQAQDELNRLLANKGRTT